MFIGREYVDNIVLADKNIDDYCWINTQEGLTKVPPVMSKLWQFENRPEPEKSCICQPVEEMKLRINGVSNSQRDFALIPGTFALRDKARRGIMSYGHCTK